MTKSIVSRTNSYKVWEEYVKTRNSDIAPPHILRSWKRCSQFNVDPFSDDSPAVGNSRLIANKINDNLDLHKLIQYHYNKIIGETDLSKFHVLFTDADGYILSIKGHDKILQISDNVYITKGSNISEASIGTTAPGVSLAEQRPAMINAEDHYKKILHWASCFAIPIFNHKNKIVGCLNITTNKENRHKLKQMTLFFVNIARSFQFEYFIKRKFQQLQLYSSFFDTTFKYAKKNLILIGRQFNIIDLNAEAKTYLGVGQFELYNSNLLDYFKIDANKLQSLLDSNRIDSFILNHDGHSKCVSVQVMPIYDKAGIETSYLLELRPEKKKFALNRLKQRRQKYTFDRIIGRSPRFINIIKKAKKASKTMSNILIEGETGTGKELFAQSIHEKSRFYKGPFIAINCSAFPNELVESELFGYEKGAYTGAKKNGSPGKFEMANNGTLFFDEIHTMSLPTQMKILRAVEDRSVTRIGGKTPIPLNIRIITATSEHLEMEVQNNRFLSALFFRLNVVRLTIPTLKDRKDDIPLLIDHFISKMNQKFERSILGMSKDASQLLQNYSWPGNIRELKNVIENAFVFCEKDFITKDCLNLPEAAGAVPLQDQYKGQTMEEITRQLLSDNLKRFGNVKDAAIFLNIPVSTFYKKMKKFGLSK